MPFPRLFWKFALANAAINLLLAPVLLVIAGSYGVAIGPAVVFVLLLTTAGMTAAGAAWGIAARPWWEVKRVINAIGRFPRDEAAPQISVDLRSATAPLMLALQSMQMRVAQRLERLAEENQWLVRVVEGIEQGLFALDAERRVVLANAAARRILQIPTGKVVGRPLLEVVRSREVHIAVEDAFHGAAVVEAEFEVTGDDRRHVHLRAKRIAGQPLPGVVVVVDDVSRLRRLEKLRTEFAANVSHELKTPLASIKAYAETLRLGAVNDPEHNLAFVARIEEHADRLHDLIADLIRLSRVEAGKGVFDIADFPLDELVEECVEYHRESADAKNITVEVEPPESSVEVRGDEVGVRTILDNLMNNAIKYTPDGGRVTIGWRHDGGGILLEVRDTGIGISPEDQDRVFERFFRVDQARSRELGGTGLGLSIVKHTALALGGRVGLESRPSHGSTFRVWLPKANGAKPN